MGLLKKINYFKISLIEYWYKMYVILSKIEGYCIVNKIIICVNNKLKYHNRG